MKIALLVLAALLSITFAFGIQTNPNTLMKSLAEGSEKPSCGVVTKPDDDDDCDDLESGDDDYDCDGKGWKKKFLKKLFKKLVAKAEDRILGNIKKNGVFIGDWRIYQCDCDESLIFRNLKNQKCDFRYAMLINRTVNL